MNFDIFDDFRMKYHLKLGQNAQNHLVSPENTCEPSLNTCEPCRERQDAETDAQGDPESDVGAIPRTCPKSGH